MPKLSAMPRRYVQLDVFASRPGAGKPARAPSRPDDMVRARGSDAPRAGKPSRSKDGGNNGNGNGNGGGSSKQDKSARGAKASVNKKASRKSASKARKSQR